MHMEISTYIGEPGYRPWRFDRREIKLFVISTVNTSASRQIPSSELYRVIAIMPETTQWRLENVFQWIQQTMY